jgi:aminopeptidase N
VLPNLTRNEALERAALVTVNNYRIELDLNRGEHVFGSTTTVTFEALPGADS